MQIEFAKTARKRTQLNSYISGNRINPFKKNSYLKTQLPYKIILVFLF